MSRLSRLLAASAIALAAVVLFSEALHWRASRRALGTAGATRGEEAVVVLGFANAGGRANFVNRWRVRAGIRSFDSHEGTTLLVLCGGAVRGVVPEAELMARYARDELGYTGPIALDVASRSTWQNVENAIPLVEGAATIKIVSNSLHAAKARSYLWRHRPDLATRLRRGDDNRIGELLWLKPVAVFIDLRHTLRTRRVNGDTDA